MLFGIKSVVKYILGTDIADRNVAVYADDTFLVSYPRSGNTWTRFLIATLLHPEVEVGFANIDSFVPDTAALSSRALKRTPRPRVLKSHQYFDHRYPKVIYIVRDPRDVALSYYHFHRKYGFIHDDHPIEQFVTDFVGGRLVSADWGTWAANVASWIYTRGHSPTFLLARYEDLKQNTHRELSRIATFLGVDGKPELLTKVIERSSLQRMRELEVKEQDEWLGSRKHRKDIPFVGEASAGGWEQKLPAASVALIESAWGELMTKLGYKLSTKLAAIDGQRGLAAQVSQPLR
ncbi:MAG: sulfotransferase domain-containing protein [Terriglobales bacterium]